MADNTVLNAGAGGDTYASDDIAGIKYQRVKLVEGADGVNDGDISSANPLPVSQIGAIPAGSNNIGDVDVLTLPALVAGTANIGDVDVLSVPAPLSTSGGGTEAAALRVTIANDSTGLVSVDDNAASLTVDAPVGTPVAVRLSDGTAFLFTPSGALRTDPTAVNTPVIGVVADDSANTSTKLAVLPARSNAASPAWTEGRQVPLSEELNGGLRVNPMFGKTFKTAAISVAATGDNTIVAAVASKRIKVYAINLAAVGTVSAKWKDGAATDLSGAQDLQAREGYTISVAPPSFVLATTAGNALILNLSPAIGVRGWVTYWDDDAT